MATSELATTLDETTYDELFLRLSSDGVDELWSRAGAEGLAAVIAAPDSSSRARFLAAEILFRKDPGYRPAEPETLAAAYAAELRGAEIANMWGMPGELDGPAGKHLVALGEPAVSVLADLLGDTRELSYAGSKEATAGNEYSMRVKDFAAFFVSKIKGVPLQVAVEPAVRDAEIDKLRASL